MHNVQQLWRMWLRLDPPQPSTRRAAPATFLTQRVLREITAVTPEELCCLCWSGSRAAGCAVPCRFCVSEVTWGDLRRSQLLQNVTSCTLPHTQRAEVFCGAHERASESGRTPKSGKA